MIYRVYYSLYLVTKITNDMHQVGTKLQQLRIHDEKLTNRKYKNVYGKEWNYKVQSTQSIFD